MSVDGGFDYTRVLGEPSKRRAVGELPPENFPWGTLGKDGKGPMRTVLLGDCETSHLQAIIRTVRNLHPQYLEGIRQILAKREAHMPQPVKGASRLDVILDEVVMSEETLNQNR